MLWLKLLVVVAAGLAGSQGSPKHADRDKRQSPGYNCEAYWHYKFTNFTTPSLKAIHDGIKLKIFYRDAQNAFSPYLYSCIDTQNFYQFVNRRPMQFAKGSTPLQGLLYDDSNLSGTRSTMLSERNVYPAIIALSLNDAYSSVDDNVKWLKTCEDCVGYTVDETKTNSEIYKYKSADGTPFWASFNKNNRIVTSRDMRTWTFKTNLPLNVQIHNSFPITIDGQPRWVLVQVVNNVYNYYWYYVGDMTYEDGYANERGPYNLTWGADDLDLFFANKGDTVDDFQYMIPTLINTYVGFNGAPIRAPIILGTPRRVRFREVRGVQRIYQEVAADYRQIPLSYRYTFDDVTIVEALVNPLNSIAATQFTVTKMVFDLMDSKEVGIGIRKLTDAKGVIKEITRIGYKTGDIYYCDRTKSGVPAGFPLTNQDKYMRIFDAREKPASLSNIEFQIFADGCSLEVFAEQGLINFNLLIFPQKQSNRMEIFTSRGDAKLVSLEMLVYDKS